MRDSWFPIVTALVIAAAPFALADAVGQLLPPLPSADGPSPAVLEALAKLGPHGAVLGPGFEPPGVKNCGTITLVFRNPDLQVRDDGFIHASGRFFIQFQAIGEGAEQVAKFGYSFGKPIPESLHSCETPEWVTGAYLKNYRFDETPEDGFFVPINSTFVTDGEYASAVHAYDAAGHELSRWYASALVENGKASPADNPTKDAVQPWPMVLPGDGEQTHGVNGLTVEFAEDVQVPEVQVTLNGAPLTLAEWTPPERDDDALVDNPVHSEPVKTRVWGNGFKFEGAVRAGDVIRVRAVDLAGNVADKILHVGDTTSGGIVALTTPDLVLEAVDGTEKAPDGSKRASFNLRFQNIGQGEAHVGLRGDAPAGITVSLQPEHVVVETGAEAFATAVATVTAEARPGAQVVRISASYKSGAEERVETLDLRVNVGGTPAEIAAAADNSTADGGTLNASSKGPSQETPGAGVALVVLSMALAVAGLRRFR